MLPNMTEDQYSGVIYGYYVKYDRLAQLINSNFKNSKANKITMFIDVYDILIHLSRYMKDNQAIITNRYFIASGIINICAHYREFFRRYYSVDTTFYLIYTDINNIINKYFYKDYSKETIKTNPNYSLFKDNLDMIKLISNFLPNIYYITADDIEFSNVVIDIIIHNKVDSLSIILSKDYYTYQLVKPSIYILRPKKNKSEDLSNLVSITNVSAEYISEISKSKAIVNIPYSQMSLFMSLTRVPNRNIKTLVNFTRISKLYTNPEVALFNSGRRINDILFAVDEFNKFLYPNTIDPHEVYCRFKAIDSISLSNVTANNPHLISYEGMVDLYDVKKVHYIQSTYFQGCPLDLEVL